MKLEVSKYGGLGTIAVRLTDEAENDDPNGSEDECPDWDFETVVDQGQLWTSESKEAVSSQTHAHPRRYHEKA